MEIQLDVCGLGSALGDNFTLSIDSGTVSPSGVTRNDLLSGITVTASTSAATTITVTSLGVCTNSLTIPLTYPTTTTTTTTAQPYYFYNVQWVECGDCGSGFSAIARSLSILTTGKWYVASDPNYVLYVSSLTTSQPYTFQINNTTAYNNCGPVPCTTTTTTTTAAPNNYLVELYNCGGCELAGYAVIDASYSLTSGKYYYLSSGYIGGWFGAYSTSSPDDSIFSLTEYGSCIGLPCL
jgi:hypothetical protein